jgi:uncharacterized protein
MITRKSSLQILLKEFPAVAILGPRQVGKSTLARQAAATTRKKVLFLDMELESDKRKMEDPESYLAAHRDKLVIIDEIQQMPHLFAALRPEIDALRKPGRFILTGSANPALVKGVSETLAGRIAYMPLTPFRLDEISNAGYSMTQHWFRGGFPGAFLAKTNDAFHRWMESYIQSFVQRDLQQLFDVNLSAAITRNIWTMIANNNGGILNTENYARALGTSAPTVKRYLAFLEGAFLIRLLQPWYANSNKRLVKSPKVYIRDSGIVHHFAHIEKATDLPGHLITGASWEGYVIEEIIRLLPAHILPYFYRTHHGAEADLLLVKNNQPFAAIEIKHSKSPVISDGFYSSIEDTGAIHKYVIYTGTETYTTKHKIIVTGLEHFLTTLLKKIK